MDELATYCFNKKNRIWVAYALDRTSKQVVDFIVGKRNKTNLRKVDDTLVLSDAKKICTDRLNIYSSIIPNAIHHVKQFGINHIERKNISLRTHLKRLNRRTICYSKSIAMLTACLKIYFWG